MFEVIDTWTDEVIQVFDNEVEAWECIRGLAMVRGENEGNWNVRYPYEDFYNEEDDYDGV